MSVFGPCPCRTGALDRAGEPADAAAHQGAKVRRRHPLWRDGARRAARARRGVPAARQARACSGTTWCPEYWHPCTRQTHCPPCAVMRGSAHAAAEACRACPHELCLSQPLCYVIAVPGRSSISSEEGSHICMLPWVCRLHTSSDYTVMDACAACGSILTPALQPAATDAVGAHLMPARGQGAAMMFPLHHQPGSMHAAWKKAQLSHGCIVFRCQVLTCWHDASQMAPLACAHCATCRAAHVLMICAVHTRLWQAGPRGVPGVRGGGAADARGAAVCAQVPGHRIGRHEYQVHLRPAAQLSHPAEPRGQLCHQNARNPSRNP